MLLLHMHEGVLTFADSVFRMGWTSGPARHLALHEEVGQGVHH